MLVRDTELAIKLLAESLYDYGFSVKGATFRKLSGKRQGASHYEPCLECGGTWLEGEKTGDRAGYRKGAGVYRDRFKREQPCEGCGGYRKPDGTIVPGEGRVGVDRMTGSRVGTEATYAQPGRDSWPCNFCTPLGSVRDVKRGTGVDVSRRLEDGSHPRCEPCGGTGTRTASKGLGVEPRRLDDVDVTLTAIERGIRERNAVGHYHELEVCLAELARRSPHRHRVFHGVHVVKTLSAGVLSGTEAVLLRQAYADLSKWLRAAVGGEVRVPAEVLALHRRDPDGRLAAESRLRVKGSVVPKRMLADRDAEIVKRSRSESTLAIAESLGLSVRQVQRVLDRDVAA